MHMPTKRAWPSWREVDLIFVWLHPTLFIHFKLLCILKKPEWKQCRCPRASNHILHFPMAVVFFQQETSWNLHFPRCLTLMCWLLGKDEKNNSHSYDINLTGHLWNVSDFNMGALHLQQSSKHHKELTPWIPPAPGGNNEEHKRSKSQQAYRAPRKTTTGNPISDPPCPLTKPGWVFSSFPSW